jgi:hypothetical protein
MFSTSIHNLHHFPGYAVAHEYFSNTKKPVTRNGAWRDNQRPLKDSRSLHYRIERGNDGEYYDVCLHRTVMARYYKPTAEGRHVLYTGHPSNMSKQFMRHVLNVHHYNERITTDGRRVAMPISDRDCITDKGSTFSTKLWLVDRHLIDVDKSVHTPHYTHRMSADDKATHKQARANMEPYVTLACMRIPEFLERVNIDYDLLEPFKGVEIDWSDRRVLERIAQGMPDIPQAEINTFMFVAEKVYDYEATKAAEKYPNDHISEHITEKVLADALWRITKRECPFLNLKSAATPLPQFMNVGEYPRTTARPYA